VAGEGPIRAGQAAAVSRTAGNTAPSGRARSLWRPHCAPGRDGSRPCGRLPAARSAAASCAVGC